MEKKTVLIGNKSSDRIQIINILAATSIALLTVLVGLSNKDLNFWMLFQLSISVPCFITSSLAYSKLSYRDSSEIGWWNSFAWLSFSIGYVLILNSMSILLYQTSKTLAYWFIGFASLLFASYSLLDIFLNKTRSKEKIFKLFFYLFLIFLGFFIPALNGHLIK